MKTISIASLILLAASAVAGDPTAEKISVFTGTWLIDFDPAGRAAAYYGSNPGDSGYVDEGTIDFTALLEGVVRAEKKNAKGPGDRYQVSIQYEGQTSATAFVLVDDSIIQRTLIELDGKWKPHPVGQRFSELKAKYPIIPRKEEASEPAQ